ncbi:MAG: FHA domain-containing protein [Anaerolineae bacterium]|jgi:pSer/pThr/pTyr-binding forkhead associated (FHA) protein|nr:FHA domain-containing protein [Anaerolineae bacterium]
MNFRTPRRTTRREISITFMSGPNDGISLPFTQPGRGEERTLTIGRREGSDIHLPFDSQVSRNHARLTCALQPASSSDIDDMPYVMSFTLEDTGSRNGTFIEKHTEPIAGKVSLRPGALFRIGRTWLRLDIPVALDE